MEQIFAVRSQEELHHYRAVTSSMLPQLDRFLRYLQDNFQVTDLPRAIVWTDVRTATSLLSDIPLPAYTNNYRVMFCPDTAVWQELYLRQLDQQEDPFLREYYQNRLTQSHVLQILGHEFVHHSDLFAEDFDGSCDQGIWFEEGMCEYISHTFFLTQAQLQESLEVSARLVDAFEQRHGHHSLEEFGTATYGGSYAGIFYEYHRSFLAVAELVSQRRGNILRVFEDYHRWCSNPIGQSLAQFFELEA